ncbi:Peptide methionine sulfoxide reductase MsrA 2 [Rhodospirillaceae bacterium LM-1]|nr:Peptide methionine sulfoxide reductase MsrA 2 [Rhodospirillaceae bacterium LM-1]
MKSIFGLLPAAALVCGLGEAQAVPLPDPELDAPKLSQDKSEPKSIVLAGGCFWGVQAVFQHVKGVTQAISGYAGGAQATARYELVSGGGTGHAESVLVIYDPSLITLGKLLKVFFSVVHNPTELNRQGPDTGTQYRSAIFPSDDEQDRIARAYILQLDRSKIFKRPIATVVEPLRKFYPAESYHQNYVRQHPESAYVAMHDLPKVANLGKAYPELLAVSR